MKDLDTLKMDELHGILIAYEMRKGSPNFKEAAFKASRSTKEGKGWNYNSDESDAKTELAQFVRRLKMGFKLNGKYPLICFNYGRIGHYVAKCPHKHDSDDEKESKRMMYKKKGFNKKNFFSKQDESDEDEFVVIKRNQPEICIITKKEMMNQMMKVIMLEEKKHYSWHLQMMMTQN